MSDGCDECGRDVDWCKCPPADTDHVAYALAAAREALKKAGKK